MGWFLLVAVLGVVTAVVIGIIYFSIKKGR
ncbi:hypothetical protein ES705_27503 [subsurface metagenome]